MTTYGQQIVEELRQATTAVLCLADLDLSQLSDDDFERVILTFNRFYDDLHAALAKLRNADDAEAAS
jgi:hypothetical protein